MLLPIPNRLIFAGHISAASLCETIKRINSILYSFLQKFSKLFKKSTLFYTERNFVLKFVYYTVQKISVRNLEPLAYSHKEKQITRFF